MNFTTYAVHHYSDGEIIAHYGYRSTRELLRMLWEVSARSSERYGSVHIYIWQE